MGAVDFVVLVWIRVDEGPNNFLIRSNLDENPVPSGADKGIIVEDRNAVRGNYRGPKDP